MLKEEIRRQEKLVAGYLEDARSARQLVDSATLSESLLELRKENARLKSEEA